MGYQNTGLPATTVFAETFAALPVGGAPAWICGGMGAAGGPLFTFNGAFRTTGGAVGGRPTLARPSFCGQRVANASVSSVYGKWTYTSSAGLHRGGPAIALAGDAENGIYARLQGYMLQMVVDGASANFSNIADGGPNLVAGVLVPANNDIYEMQIDFAVASNRCRLWQNGTLRLDYTDSAANRPGRCQVAGFFFDNSGGGTQVWSTFETRASRP